MEKKEKNLFYTYNFALVVIRHGKTGKFLCVEESKNQGWWLAGGKLSSGESFYDAAHREVWEEGGVKINIKGILRIEHSTEENTARMRVIFYGESLDDNPKSIEDNESKRAIWCSTDEIRKLNLSPPYHRGSEIIEWPEYIEAGGIIFPCEILCNESDEIKIIK